MQQRRSFFFSFFRTEILVLRPVENGVYFLFEGPLPFSTYLGTWLARRGASDLPKPVLLLPIFVGILYSEAC